MLLDKVPWISHNRTPIFSIDVDASGTRVCTSGQDQKTRIWNTRPLLHESAELDPAIPRLLCTLSHHTGPVNVARFSKSGKVLASGADDRLICLYELRPGAATAAFGSSDSPNLENWKQVTALRGHENNVVDLAWSPDGSQIASASLDNLVIVWDVASAGKAAVLRAHRGFVKGVAWDPFNQYLASQGEQDGVYLFKVGEWAAPIRHITNLMCDSPSLGFHSRLSWSPDGQYLLCTGYGKPFYLGVLTQRNHDWDCEHSLAGHRSGVTVTKFSPRLVHMKGQASEQDEVSPVAVLGSQDKCFSVWVLGQPTPLVSGKNFFAQGVMDVAWTPDGLTLMVCSYDGTVAVCKFEEGELGRIASDSEVKELIGKLYANNTDGKVGGSLTPSIAAAQLHALPDPEAAPAPLPAAATGPGVAAAAKAAQQAPLLAARLGEGAEGGVAGTLRPTAPRTLVPEPLGGGGAAVAVTRAAGAPRRLQPTPLDPSAPAAAPPRTLPPPVQPTVAAVGAAAPAERRLASPAAAPRAAPPLEAPPAKRLAPTRTAGPSAGAPATAVTAAPAAAATAAAAAAPRPTTAAAAAAAHVGRKQPVLQPAPVTELVAQTVETAAAAATPDDSAAAGPSGGSLAAASAPATLTLQAINGRQRDARGERVAQLQCSTSSGGGGGGGSRAFGGAGGHRLLWRDQISGDVVLIAGSPHFLAVATSLGELQVFSHAGRRLLPPIQLPGTAAFLATDARPRGGSAVSAGSTLTGPSGGVGWKLLVVTSDADLLLWDLQRRVLVAEASAAPLLASHRDSAFSSVRLAAGGVPVVVLPSGRGFAFHLDMRCWVRVADAGQPATFHTSSLPLITSHGEVSAVQTEAARQLGAGAGLHTGRLGGLSQVVGGAGPGQTQDPHELLRQERCALEGNMASALAMRSFAEYERWLVTYARKIAADADHARMREVWAEVQQGVGLPKAGAPGAGGPATPQHELLKRLYKEFVRNPANHALVQELQDQDPLSRENPLRAQQPRGQRDRDRPRSSGMGAGGGTPSEA